MADNKDQQPGQAKQQQPPSGRQEGQSEGPSASPTPLEARQLRHARARRYNKQHSGESAEFQKLTGIDPMNISAIVQWQYKHAVKADGKIGLQTIEAASGPSGTLVASAGPVALPTGQGPAIAPPAAKAPVAEASAVAPAPARGPKADAAHDEAPEEEHEGAFELHHDPRVKRPDEINHLGKEKGHEEHEADDEHDVGTVGRVKDKDYPEQLVQVPHGHRGKKVELTPETAAAYEALLSHARAAGFAAPLFEIESAWRSDANQAGLAADAEKQHPGANNRKWVAKPGGSAHRTGHAIDFVLSVPNHREYVDQQRQTKEYKWMKDNAANFGFSPYDAEPWHWEFNPKKGSL